MIMDYPRIDMYKTGQNIRKLRVEKGITAEQLSEMLGISPHSVYKWQCGKSLPSLDNMLLLGYIFQTSVNNIIVFAEDKPPVELEDDADREIL